jgi:DNA-binding LacI/PurR family transcriptional regulator
VVRHNGSAAHLVAQFDKTLRSGQPPTACVVARCAHTLTVITHLLRHGRRIPQDIAVISRDDEAFLEHVTPSVTRYAANQLQFARRVSAAARQLAETGVLPPRAMRLMPKLIRGETV